MRSVVRSTSIATVIGCLAPVLLSACARSPQSAAAVRAAEVAATSDQARLWREAADRGWAPGLERLTASGAAVQTRNHAATSSQQAPQQPVVIPGEVANAIRVVSAPVLAAGGFAGFADVVDAAGDRLELRLGPQWTLVLLARVQGNPLSSTRGGRVQVDYRVRTEPRVPNEVIAVTAESGRGIVSAVRGGSAPVTVTVPMFNLVAKQVGSPPAMTVDVAVGTVHKTVAVGQPTPVGDLTVLLFGSRALTGDNAARAEGSPFSIDMLAWRAQ